jgi:anti-sigma B factor antagonist
MSTGETYFQVAIEPDSEPTRVVASGELDAATAGQLAESLDGLPDGTTAVSLDLADVTFIDSSGLRVIAAEVRRADETGRPFTVTAASEPVRRIFEMTGLGDLLTP